MKIGSWDFDVWLKKDIGVCVTKLDGQVLFQNPCCVGICGNQVDRLCTLSAFTPCKHRFLRNPVGEGTYRFSAESLDGQEFDVLCINDSNLCARFIYPLSLSRSRELKIFEKEILSLKEHEVVKLLVSRASRADISAALDITENTVKWYLRGISKKLSNTGKQLLKKIRDNK